MPNIMREFKIAELSCVDRPAQKEARAVLMKRDDRADVLSFDTFEHAVAHLAKVSGMSGSAALAACARRYPELLAKYQKGSPAGSAAPDAVAKAERDFQLVVDEIAKRDRCPRADAMSKAARERPDLLRAYQDA